MIATDTLDALTAEVAVNAAVAHLRGCFLACTYRC